MDGTHATHPPTQNQPTHPHFLGNVTDMDRTLNS